MFLSRHHISFEGNINAMEKSNLMNVGLLTSHSSMNYGGLLQAYALREKIRECGYNCNIINYKPKVHDINKHPIKFVIQRKNFIIIFNIWLLFRCVFIIDNINSSFHIIAQNTVAIYKIRKSAIFSLKEMSESQLLSKIYFLFFIKLYIF